MTDDARSLQARFAPDNACFGCGQANPLGLRLESHPSAEDPDRVVARWAPEAHHQAFPGMVNGGILGALLDCHMNWTAAWHLLRATGAERPPCTVTMTFTVELNRPTPLDAVLELEARVVEADARRARVEASLSARGEVCARGSGRFAAVGPGHPAHAAR